MTLPSQMPRRPLRGARLALAYAAVSAVLATPLAVVSAAQSTASSATVVPGEASPSPSDSASASSDAAATPTPDPASSSSQAPSPDPTPSNAAPTATPSGSSTPAGGSDPTPTGPATASPSVDPTGPGRVVIAHTALARVPTTADSAAYLDPDVDLSGAAPFDRVRVRFAVSNPGVDPVTFRPLLQLATATLDFAAVGRDDDPGVVAHLEREWVRYGSGSVVGPAEDVIAVADFRADSTDGAVTGHRSLAANPDRELTVGPGQRTEVEFALELGRDAPPRTAVELRLTDDGTVVTGGATTTVMTRESRTVLTPGQHNGADVPAPTGRDGTATGAVRLTVGVSAADATAPATAARSLAEPGTAIAVTGTGGGHGTGSPSSAECATCHQGHTGKGSALLPTAPQSRTCFVCHGGTGSASSIEADWALARPANDPAAAAIWSHDATATLPSHDLASGDEMAGTSNRHAQCADCHNSHRARSGVVSTQQSVGGATIGWSASGSLQGAPGLQVTNGAAGSTPAYTVLDGVLEPVTLEYQVCLTCHTSRTTLPAGVAGRPSTASLDKGVELNPANPSFHPVEAAGTNQTTKMAASLAGTSPFKLWDFATTDTVRCVSCHASSSTGAVAAGGALSPHTSAHRGILLRPYKDRVLKRSGEPYAADDFALCLVCHAEEPFANASGPASTGATNYSLHGKHLTGMAGKGNGGTDIDTAGAGQGNATCAECHFRLHGSATALPGQSLDGSRLVTFAPDVQPVTAGGTIVWSRDPAGGGSCTLTCHGKVHNAMRYR